MEIFWGLANGPYWKQVLRLMLSRYVARAAEADGT
jgi:hypothetical protein